MASATSQMRREVMEIPAAIDRLLSQGAGPIGDAAAAIRELDPPFVVTVARGSSDHICSYLKYVGELLHGVPFASIGPSMASIYRAPLNLDRSACISVSQSGQSPDITEMAAAARRDGALTLAITNDTNSPLARASEWVLDLHAGPELSVAATKTFATSAVVGLWLLAEWQGDEELRRAIFGLPSLLQRSAELDWPEFQNAIGSRTSLFTIGRGPASAMASEAALKFKETCQLHAESYSSAEVLHGPISIVGPGFPVLVFAAGDAAEPSVAEVSDQIVETGASVFVTSDLASAATRLEHVRTDHPLTDPISLIVSFYAMVERVATAKGIDPDAPRHLKKVTETV